MAPAQIASSPPATEGVSPTAGADGGSFEDRVRTRSSPLVRKIAAEHGIDVAALQGQDRKSTRLNSSHANISYAVFCLKKQTRQVRPVTKPQRRQVTLPYAASIHLVTW